MSQMTHPVESLEAWASVLLRAWIIGFVLLFISAAAFLLGGSQIYDLQSRIFDISRANMDLVYYCFLGSMKLIVLLFFFIPWLAIRLTLRKYG